MTTANVKRIARVFQEPDGGWHYCADTFQNLDARGIRFETRREARRAAVSAGYTHDQKGRLPKPCQKQR